MARTRRIRRKTTRRSYTSRRSSPAARLKRAAQRRRKVIKLWGNRLLASMLVLICIPLLARAWMHFAAADLVYSDINRIPKSKVALVLGAGVRPNGSLTNSLASRVDKAIELYKAGKVEKLLMSGDNRFTHYNEPERMCEYAMKHGVPRKDITMDFAGRRTYDSIYRARHIWGIKKLIVVTQSFHIDRAIFLCDHLGVKAYGLETSTVPDFRATIREIPACLAALSDIYIRQPKPVMGEKETI